MLFCGVLFLMGVSDCADARFCGDGFGLGLVRWMLGLPPTTANAAEGEGVSDMETARRGGVRERDTTRGLSGVASVLEGMANERVEPATLPFPFLFGLAVPPLKWIEFSSDTGGVLGAGGDVEETRGKLSRRGMALARRRFTLALPGKGTGVAFGLRLRALTPPFKGRMVDAFDTPRGFVLDLDVLVDMEVDVDVELELALETRASEAESDVREETERREEASEGVRLVLWLGGLDIASLVMRR